MVKKHRSTKSILLRVVCAAMGNLYYGYALAYYSLSQGSIVQILGYQNSNHKATLDGLINSILPLGGAIGAFLSCNFFISWKAKIVKKYGFRQSFLICDCFGLVVVAASLELNLYSIIITRFLFGLIVGVNSAIDPQYIQKISPNSISGIVGVVSSFMLLLGQTISFSLTWALFQLQPLDYDQNQDYGIFGFNSWRIIFGFPAITCIIRLMTFGFIYIRDLPQELLERGEVDQARIMVLSIYEDEFVQEEMKELQYDSLIKAQSQTFSYRDLFTQVERKKMLVASGLSVLNQWSGINVKNFYGVIIFTQITKGDLFQINLLTFMGGVASLIVTLISGLLINRFGRRIILLVGNTFCFISLSILTGLYMALSLQQDTITDKQFQTLQISITVALFTFIVVYSMSLGPVFWIYISELLPSKGLGIVVVQNWILLALLAQLFPIIADKSAVYVCFSVFVGITFFGEFFIYYYVMETKTLSKAQIHNMFRIQQWQDQSTQTPSDNNNPKNNKNLESLSEANKSIDDSGENLTSDLISKSFT